MEEQLIVITKYLVTNSRTLINHWWKVSGRTRDRASGRAPPRYGENQFLFLSILPDVFCWKAVIHLWRKSVLRSWKMPSCALSQSSPWRWRSPKVERGCRQGGMKTSVSRRGGKQLRLGSIKRKGKHDVGVKRVRGATRNREVNPGFLLSLPWRAPKVPTNMGKGSKSTKILPPDPKEFRIRVLLLCQPRKKDVTVGWTQHEWI